VRELLELELRELRRPTVGRGGGPTKNLWLPVRTPRPPNPPGGGGGVAVGWPGAGCMFGCMRRNHGSSHMDKHMSIRGRRPLREGRLCLLTLTSAGSARAPASVDFGSGSVGVIGGGSSARLSPENASGGWNPEDKGA
jgi:hypothetical protein